MIPHRRLLFAAGFTAVAALLIGASTPIIPTAPIVDFRLPVFNEQGYRFWEVRGSEALFDPKEERAEIKSLRLTVYSGDDRGLVENVVESPFAVLERKTLTVSGPGLIRLIGYERGREFEVRGEDWTYQETPPTATSPEKTKSVVIRKNVVVTFAQDIG
ncbi:MAG: hypothetical protein IAE82_15440, partial [Opitutaceae bacterium]|nr:hypothetical protein [Opitutaceae bacterium]